MDSTVTPCRSRVIALDPSSARFQRFLQNNPGLQPEVFVGLRGDCVSPRSRIEQGLVTEALAQSGRLHEGALGCAMSHRSLWQEATTQAGGMLILEDDVVTHPALMAWIHQHHQQLLRYDVVHFTINTDSVLTTVSPQGLVQSCLFQPQHPDPAWIDAALQATPLAEVRLLRLLHAFGTCCYFVSPAGAQRLLGAAFPLTLETAPIPLISNAMRGISIDRRLNAFYPNLRAAIAIPFLAYTPNIDSSSQG